MAWLSSPEHLIDHAWAFSCDIPNKLSTVCTAEAAVSSFFCGQQEVNDKIWLRPAWLKLTMSAVSADILWHKLFSQNLAQADLLKLILSG